MPAALPYVGHVVLRALVSFAVLRGAFHLGKGVAQGDGAAGAPVLVLAALVVLTWTVGESWVWRARERWLADALGMDARRRALVAGAVVVVGEALARWVLA